MNKLMPVTIDEYRKWDLIEKHRYWRSVMDQKEQFRRELHNTRQRVYEKKRKAKDV